MEKLLCETKNRITKITINRPDARNAIDQDVHSLLIAAFSQFRDDPEADVAILTGQGEAFCAGMDLKKFVPTVIGASPQDIQDIAKMGLGGITRGLHRIDKPIIAAVNGWAMAAGFELALASDIRIASEEAVFCSSEARRGFHHCDGGIPRLVNTCGVGPALELLLTADPITAERAYQLNLVSSVVAHNSLMDAAEDMAARLLRNDQAAIRSAKLTILNMIGRGLDDQLHQEAVAGYSRMASGKDVAARLNQFYNKTDPQRIGDFKRKESAV
ncbi:enoyl-CoA hydratase/isomerase family protein [Paraburkholderia lacunae]|uniref:Enoyl-CoA hydratase/isomerase family protein n=1 Tax=Paraburkholderia lacunae TaxID=2211104 RepID=A0A370N7Y7_9BURK|nr:enoyl-CoA hydratase/isomerase family protein [Paraburkholderia lacunae]RDK01729.1 enoyl-CoA hydratase/isomerase family protein [Paraburkholderia lacunae]